MLSCPSRLQFLTVGSVHFVLPLDLSPINYGCGRHSSNRIQYLFSVNERRASAERALFQRARCTRIIIIQSIQSVDCRIVHGFIDFDLDFIMIIMYYLCGAQIVAVIAIAVAANTIHKFDKHNILCELLFIDSPFIFFNFL